MENKRRNSFSFICVYKNGRSFEKKYRIKQIQRRKELRQLEIRGRNTDLSAAKASFADDGCGDLIFRDREQSCKH